MPWVTINGAHVFIGEDGSREGTAHKEQAVQSVVKEHFGVKSLAAKGRDRYDFHEVGVWRVKKGLTAAYHADHTGGKLDTAKRDKAIADIADRHLNVKTLETRNNDDKDFHSLHVRNIRTAVETAYDTGKAHSKK